MTPILNDVTDVLHKIRVKRSPNYLGHKVKIEGTPRVRACSLSRRAVP
ncbi:MAG: hypothetical protein LBT00_12215 [Spirochaetaceae bacterium]|jgi:hypothetical protein|nr:hypothetical protein [Spirochaetaceae bacterium]